MISLYAMFKFTLLCLLGLLGLRAAGQNIPPLQGKTDSKGGRQGQWIIWYNEEWKETQNRQDVKFYRSISYKDDLPDKPVQDYYASGVIQMKGVFMKDRPNPVYDGWISFYYENGQERLRVKYDKGDFAKEFLAFHRDGSPVALPWDEPVTLAESEEDPKKRVALLLQGRDNAEALFTNKSLQYAERLESLGYEYFLSDDYQTATTTFELAASLFKKHLAQNDIRIADALYFLSISLSKIGKKEEEKKALSELVELVDTHHGGSYPYLVTVLSSLGPLYENEPEKAYQYLSRGFDLIIKTTATNEDYQRAIPLLYNIHSYCLDVKDWEKARKINDQALILVEKWEGKKSDNYIEMVSIRSTIERSLGKGKGVKEAMDQQVELAQNTFSATDSKYANVLVDKASYEADRGNYAEAEKLLLQAKKIYIDTKHTADPAYGTLFNTLMTIYHDLGNEEKETEAELDYQNYIVKENGYNSTEFITYLQSRAMHMVQQKDYLNAEKVLLDGQKIVAKIDSLNTEPPEAINGLKANGYSCLAMLYLYMFQDLNNQITKNGTDEQKTKWITVKDELISRTEEYMEESLALQKKSSKGIDLQVQLILLKIMQGDFEEAQSVAGQAQQDIKDLWGQDHPMYSNVLIIRATLSAQIKNYQEAFSFYQQAFTHFKNYSNSVAPYLSESERQIFFTEINNKLQQFTGFMIQHHAQLSAESKGALLEAVMLNKSLGLSQLKEIRQQLTVAKDLEGLKLIDEWKNKKEQLIKVYQAEKTESIRNQQKQLEDEINQLDRTISSRSNGFTSMNSLAKATWKDLGKTLKPGEALVEMLRTQIQRTVLDTSYVAIVLRYGDTAPDLIEIPHAIRLEEKPLRFYNNSIHAQLEDRRSYQEFWKPIKSSLKNVKKVYFSPDGLYNQVNLETLFNPETGKYLADEIQLEMITS
jgi:hypothetical protein